MHKILIKAGRVLHALLNTRAAGVYILLFAIAIGVATFIENDFGTSAAQKVVYKTRWFELLLILFGASVVYNIYKFRMIQQKKWALLIFHASIIVILLGSGLTRYIGYEGVMHIREKNTSNYIVSADTYLSFDVQKDGRSYTFDEPVLFASLGNNSWKEEYLLGQDEVKVKVLDFIPNPTQKLIEDPTGKTMLKLVIGGINGREEYFLEKGQTRRIRNQLFNFKESHLSGAINISQIGESLQIHLPGNYTQTVMATQQRDSLFAEQPYPLVLRALYSNGRDNFVFSEFHPRAKLSIESEGPKVKNESLTALKMEVNTRGERKETYVYGKKGIPGKPAVVQFGDMAIAIAYGAKKIELPFALKLHQFELEKYPGTESAASYASEVQLIDNRKNIREDHRIYMNHILDYGGYRFFQSSFDKDEKGTYLSVNHDFWGTWVSYLGYALLTLGMIWVFFSKRTRFYQVQQKLKKLRAQHAALFLLLFMGFGTPNAFAEYNSAPSTNISLNHAENFSRLVVQDFKGRMKPMHTLSREILRKIYRKESFEGLSADQVLLSMFADNKEWYGVPIIKLGKHKDVQKLLGVEGSYAAYKDFFKKDGSYKFREEIRRVHSLAPIDRGVYAKELLKIDERVNILSMIFSGHLLKIIPQPNDPNNTWSAKHRHRPGQGHSHENSITDKFFSAYQAGLQQALKSQDFRQMDLLLEELKAYQEKHGVSIIPSQAQLNAEILLNNSKVFDRLTGYYMLLGLGFLTALFVSVFKPEQSMRTPYLVLFSLLGLGFVAHTAGLGLRWYVSGRAPWSNGYESMIYIAWTTTLAGVLFTRKSLGGLAATMVLAGTILFVAGLSFLDPQITPLVPVLRSYWLTIHVSLEAGSYGFLMLGAIIGLINLVLITIIHEGNRDRVKRMVTEMSYLSELTLTAGLFMISIGTYLGGVWANESWGRYWGWDAKETWALVTILLYAFILHMRIIPKLFSLFAYNLATIFGLASVIMTYYGVNYYLSGLHSYATGDPVPIPSWVYIMSAVVAVLSGFAYRKHKKYLGRSVA